MAGIRGPDKIPGSRLWSPRKEHERLGFLLQACWNLSDGGRVVTNFLWVQGQYQVQVWQLGVKRISTAPDPVLAMGMALDWLLHGDANNGWMDGEA